MISCLGIWEILTEEPPRKILRIFMPVAMVSIIHALHHAAVVAAMVLHAFEVSVSTIEGRIDTLKSASRCAVVVACPGRLHSFESLINPAVLSCTALPSDAVVSPIMHR